MILRGICRRFDTAKEMAVTVEKTKTNRLSFARSDGDFFHDEGLEAPEGATGSTAEAAPASWRDMRLSCVPGVPGVPGVPRVTCVSIAVSVRAVCAFDGSAKRGSAAGLQRLERAC
jgi:hypothetical protein